MRLDGEQIRQIILAHNRGVAHSQIANDLEVDVSTIRYHVEKTERMYGTTIGVYAVVKPKKICQHPSLQCLVCKAAQDNIRRREFEHIERLSLALQKANQILEREGYDPIKVPSV